MVWHGMAGRTSTMIGSCLFGQELVEAVRDHTEATLRGIMAKAPVNTDTETAQSAYSFI